jgi:hypothetical protein
MFSPQPVRNVARDLGSSGSSPQRRDQDPILYTYRSELESTNE